MRNLYHRFMAWLERAALPFDDDFTFHDHDGDPYP